jgi:D-alanyl-D-alanine carboxypeptidase/D-alanyl-D-alanine-endopeptidase (penicillin-binding protein 4)
MPSPTRRLVAVAVLAAAVVTATPLTAAVASPISPTGTPTRTLDTAYLRTAADSRMSNMLTARATSTLFGSSFSGSVVDATSGRVVWSRNGSLGLMPASTTKWVTATDALGVLGAGYRFTTRVRLGGQADQVVLVGSGDPALSSTQLTSLASTTATAMKARGELKVRVYADDSLFPAPSLATGWRSTYIPGDTTWLRALVVDGRQASDTSIDAANLFAAKLKGYGLAPTVSGRLTTSASAPVLASSVGQTVSQIVSTMLLWSDNEYAEALHRLVAIQTGYGSSWTAARSAQSAQLTTEGLTADALYDGSGLSRSDRLTSLQLARLATNVFEPANATKLALLRSDSALPISGQTGTLSSSYGRFTTAASKCAVGKVHAKTGTLDDAVALSGWTVGADGRVKGFAFVVNGKASSLTLRQNVDMLAATVVGCY